VSSLAIHWKALAVSEPAIASEIHQTLDVLLNLSTQIAFHLVAGFDDVADRLDVRFRELVDLAVLGNFCLGK